MRQPTETDLINDCLELLGWTNVVADAWRNNTGAAVFKGDDGRKRFVKFGRKGVSDILGVTSAGRFLAIEAKVGKNTPTPEQRAFLDGIHRAGGVALVIRDVAELNAALAHLASDPQWQPRRAHGGAA
jgi:hypothetical protein